MILYDVLSYRTIRQYLQMERIETNQEGLQHRRSFNKQQKLFTATQLLALVDKSLLQSIENIYRLKNEGLDPLQFTRFFMNCIDHDESEAPYLAAGLSQMFSLISKGQHRLKFNHITDFICEQIVQGQGCGKQLETRWIPIIGRDSECQTYLKNPPMITGRGDQICKVVLDKDILDNGKHQDIINTACFSESGRKMYCLESLSDWIGVFSSKIKLQKKVKPSSFRAKKDLAVIGISYSERQQRLGAVLKDFSLSFWEVSDNYSFEKSISTTKYCQDLQVSIWYLQFFQKWATADMEGKLCFWNLIEEKPERFLKCRHRSKISDICQIPSIFVVAVAQEQKNNESAKIQLISMKKYQILTQIDTKFERRMVHTIKYSEQYQILLAAGFEKKINLFEVNERYLDSWMRGELLGHQSSITCFNMVKRTPMVVSADDRGKIKIWNIKNFKCMQTIDFTDKVTITKILDLGCENKIAVIGSRIIMLSFENKIQQVTEVVPIKVKSYSEGMMIFSGHDIRKVDMNNGKLLTINYQFSKDRTQVTSILMTSKGYIITGTEKGQIYFYCNSSGKQLQGKSYHEGPVHYIEEDNINGLLLTFSDSSGFIVLGKINGEQWSQVRQLKGTFSGKDVTSIILSAYHSMIGFIIGQSIYILDYEQLKIVKKITFKRLRPTSLCFVNGLQLILVGTSSGQILVYELKKQCTSLMFKIVNGGDCIHQMIVDVRCRKKFTSMCLDSCILYWSVMDGSITSLNLKDWFKGFPFKMTKNNSFQNPHRQVRQNFDIQLKKFNYEEVCQNFDCEKFEGQITRIGKHQNGVTSLSLAEFEDHLLVTTGKDQRVKMWRQHKLVADFNINHPLPYIWEVDISQNKMQNRRYMQGLQIIQLLYKRFGKDISIGESQIFKAKTQNNHQNDSNFVTEIPEKDKKLKKKPTLFQEQFSSMDLNYEKIKREKILPVGGPSLKRMQLTKKITNLQKSWQVAKEKQQEEKNNLLQSIMTKSKNYEEKESVANMLRDKHNLLYNKPKEETPTIRAFQRKLDQSLDNKGHPIFFNSSRNYDQPWHQFFKSVKDQLFKTAKEQLISSISSCKEKNIRHSTSKPTLEKYFKQKFNEGRMTAESPSGSRSIRNSPKVSIHNEICQNPGDITYKKTHNFRIMMKEMRQKLSNSKNGNSLDTKHERLQRTSDFSRNAANNRSSIIVQLDDQIQNYRLCLR